MSDMEFELQPNQFQLAQVIGSGATASVYHSVNSHSRAPVAIKKLSAGYSRTALCQSAILSSLSHKNIVSFFGQYQSEGSVHLVFERCDRDLYEVLKQCRKITEQQTKHLAIQLVEALEYLHSQGVVHRDIKPENVLTAQNGSKIKLTDFGHAAANGDNWFQRKGTRAYMAPQMLSAQGYSYLVDFWSLGILLFQCLTGSLPFREQNPQDLESQILQTSPNWKLLEQEGISADCVQFLQGLLQKQPEQRLGSSDDIRCTRWLSKPSDQVFLY